MTKDNSSDPDDLVVRIVDTFQQMPVPPGPSLRETIALLDARASGSLSSQTPDAPVLAAAVEAADQTKAIRGASASAVGICGASLAILALPSSVPGPARRPPRLSTRLPTRSSRPKA